MSACVAVRFFADGGVPYKMFPLTFRLLRDVEDAVPYIMLQQPIREYAGERNSPLHSSIKKGRHRPPFLSSDSSLIKLYESLEILVYLLFEAVYLGALAAHELVVGVDLLASYLLRQSVDTRL